MRNKQNFKILDVLFRQSLKYKNILEKSTISLKDLTEFTSLI